MLHLTRTLCAVAVLGVVCFASRGAAAEKQDIVSTAVEAGSFKTLAAALQAADLVSALQGDGPFTVFAPTDEAFAKLPEGTVESLVKPENQEQLQAILKYHVIAGSVPAKAVVDLTNATTLNGQRVDIKVDGGIVKVDNATVVKTDIVCTNGIIHVIDSVILPESKSIVETAVEAGSFQTLIAAAKAAGLAEVLATKGPLTVFAPTDAAFKALPEGTVASLLKPENKDQLAAVLKYHVVAGRVYSDQAIAAKSAETLQGGTIRVSVKDGVARVNDAKLVATDIEAVNGVIHVIDSVLLPTAAKKVSVRDGQLMIEEAIAEGARLYNSGHHAACAELYMKTARQLNGFGEVMPTVAVDHIQTALAKAQATDCAMTQAWTLRHALDGAYVAMSTTPGH